MLNPDLEAGWFDYRAANEALEHGHFSKASKILRRAIAESKDSADVAPLLVRSANTLAELYFAEGQFVNAASLYRVVLDVRIKQLGADHPDVQETRRKLALALWQTGGLSPKLLAAQMN